MDDAEALAGLELRIPAGELAPLPPGMYYHHDLVGCRVETSAGDAVGEVVAVEGSGEASRLVVETPRRRGTDSAGRARCAAGRPAAQADRDCGARRAAGPERDGPLAARCGRAGRREIRPRHDLPAAVRRAARRGHRAAARSSGASWTCGCTTCATTRRTGTGRSTTCRTAAGRAWCSSPSRCSGRSRRSGPTATSTRSS